MTTVTIELSKENEKYIENYAKNNNQSISEVINDIIENMYYNEVIDEWENMTDEEKEEDAITLKEFAKLQGISL